MYRLIEHLTNKVNKKDKPDVAVSIHLLNPHFSGI